MVSLASTEVQLEGGGEWPAPPGRAALAWRDLAEGFGKTWMWSALAVQDIKVRYRGSLLGPFWLTISTLVMVSGIGVIYAQLFHIDPNTYLPSLALGLIVWSLLSSMIIEGCDTFVREGGVIQQVPIPFSTYAYRNVYRNFIVLAHNAVLIPIGLIFFWIPLDWRALQIVPALVLLAINGVWISLLLGLISARFRDVPPIVSNVMQVLFFMTPILWPIEQLGHLRAIATFNPLFAAVDVVRAPLLGIPTADSSWTVLSITTVLGCVAGFGMFARFRARIAYWI